MKSMIDREVTEPWPLGGGITNLCSSEHVNDVIRVCKKKLLSIDTCFHSALGDCMSVVWICQTCR